MEFRKIGKSGDIFHRSSYLSSACNVTRQIARGRIPHHFYNSITPVNYSLVRRLSQTRIKSGFHEIESVNGGRSTEVAISFIDFGRVQRSQTDCQRTNCSPEFHTSINYSLVADSLDSMKNCNEKSGANDRERNEDR